MVLTTFLTTKDCYGHVCTHLVVIAFACLYTLSETSLRIKDRIYQAAVRSMLVYGCETWPVGVVEKMMLMVFINDSIVHVR